MARLRLYNPSTPSSLFDQFFNELDWVPKEKTNARANIVEKKDSFLVTIEVPGFTKEDLTIDYQDNILKVSGKRSHSNHEENDHVHLNEINEETFTRTFKLLDIMDNKIEASLDHGIVHIYLPKKASGEAKKISIGEGKSFFKKFESKMKSVS